MSGFLSLLDDIAAIVKIASTQVDDIALQAAKAGSKAAGVVIDDAAVTPKYVTGLPAARELPIVWKIARSSLFNKLIILLPIALILKAYFPWMLPPLLMLGGAYLCFEGAEKVWHYFSPKHEVVLENVAAINPEHLEKERVQGAVKTDFILSAEIMTIALSAIDADDVFTQGVVLAIVAVGITAAVYGAVAILVKADDVGLRMSSTGRFALTRSIGYGIVKAMPNVLIFISLVGTLAMLWVGGSIIIHGLHELGFHPPYETIKMIASSVSSSISVAQGFVNWAVTAIIDGILGLTLGLVLVLIIGMFSKAKPAH